MPHDRAARVWYPSLIRGASDSMTLIMVRLRTTKHAVARSYEIRRKNCEKHPRTATANLILKPAPGGGGTLPSPPFRGVQTVVQTCKNVFLHLAPVSPLLTYRVRQVSCWMQPHRRQEAQASGRGSLDRCEWSLGMVASLCPFYAPGIQQANKACS